MSAASLLVLVLTLAPAPGDVAPPYVAPDVAALVAGGMRDVVTRFETDLDALRRRWDAPHSSERRARESHHLAVWDAALDGMDYEALDVGGRVDWHLLRNRIAYLRRSLELDAARWEESAALLTFADVVHDLHEARRALEPVEPAEAAARLDALAEAVDALRERVVRAEDATDGEAGAADDAGRADGPPAADDAPLAVSPLVANRTAGIVRSLAKTLAAWDRYRAGYDPLYTWWCERPYAAASKALDAYAKHLRETVAGVAESDDDTILGDPIGREALLVELRREFVPYTPEELMAIAERELAWCQARMLEASAELGFGDDWRAAQEHVKSLHVEPGGQPELIRQLAQEAVDFLRERDLVTVPGYAEALWRMEMMTPQRQKYTPYFTGGEVISVSFPTAGMEHDDKLMSMRGNNVHFSRATVHHELIPGHHLQGYMRARHATHRMPFGTPFWMEGWALYWEMVLWDAGFAQGPEDRVGMLFWRKHRCARILFSLGFHLGELNPDECIELLVERVGHERANATAEVRRSVQGGYGPLYQAAYMLGGLQLRALHREVVGGGAMTDREFHDAVLHEGSIPVEMVRALVTGTLLPRDFRTTWRFDDG